MNSLSFEYSIVNTVNVTVRKLIIYFRNIRVKLCTTNYNILYKKKPYNLKL